MWATENPRRLLFISTMRISGDAASWMLIWRYAHSCTRPFHQGRECSLLLSRPQKLAPIHYETLFYKINVAYIPFLVTKLDIKVLPCVMTFINGAMKDKWAPFLSYYISVLLRLVLMRAVWHRVTGFEGLNKAGVDSDKFSTEDLEFRLCLSGEPFLSFLMCLVMMSGTVI